MYAVPTCIMLLRASRAASPFKFIEFFRKILKYSVRTSEETHSVSITNTGRLMLFRKVIAVYCENRMNQIYSVGRMQSSLILKRVIYSKHYALKEPITVTTRSKT
jgi:thioredoxin-related protein